MGQGKISGSVNVPFVAAAEAEASFVASQIRNTAEEVTQQGYIDVGSGEVRAFKYDSNTYIEIYASKEGDNGNRVPGGLIYGPVEPRENRSLIILRHGVTADSVIISSEKNCSTEGWKLSTGNTKNLDQYGLSDKSPNSVTFYVTNALLAKQLRVVTKCRRTPIIIPPSKIEKFESDTDDTKVEIYECQDSTSTSDNPGILKFGPGPPIANVAIIIAADHMTTSGTLSEEDYKVKGWYDFQGNNKMQPLESKV